MIAFIIVNPGVVSILKAVTCAIWVGIHVDVAVRTALLEDGGGVMIVGRIRQSAAAQENGIEDSHKLHGLL